MADKELIDLSHLANTRSNRRKSWVTRHLSFQRPTAFSVPILDPDEVRYVERCSGRYIHDNHGGYENGDDDDDKNDKYAPAARTCLSHLQYLVDGKWRGEWDALLAPDYAATMPEGDGENDNNNIRKVIRLGYNVATVLRQHGGLSLCRLIQRLQDNSILREGDDLRDDPVAHSLVFSLVGWLSLLYIPAPASPSPPPRLGPSPALASGQADAADPALRISLQSRSTLCSHVPAETASRPMDELLRSFGDLLPKKSYNGGHHYHHHHHQQQQPFDYGGRTPTDTGLQLEVAQLNVAALKDMAGVQIVWVDSLSGHLAFDTAASGSVAGAPTLCLFRCPSFAKLHRSDASLLSTTLLTSRFYDEDEQPCRDFSASKLLGEVILSYDLLFRANKRSRAIYANSERQRAAFSHGQAGQARQRQTDPYLDELCGHTTSRSTDPSSRPQRRIFYDAAADFPIFQDRLRRIQDHMKGVQPTGFRALWRDQRDLRLWYTIWVVLILTVAGLLIAVVSMVLAGVQVQLAKQAMELQLQQNAQGGGS